ncbi:MAG: glycoside hydrolase family 9 protein, partial [Bacteroidota bacterium]
MIYRPAATLFLFCAVASAQERPAILVDQLGYLPDEKKIAIIRDLRAELVEVRNTVTNKTVYTGKVKGVGRRDESTGDETFLFDFSELINPGNYQLWIPGTEVASTEFSIGPDVYLEAALSSLQSFYYQRCGIEVSNGSPWVHPPCHLQDALQYGSPSHRNDVVGGWHDAGDYGKFVATGAVSAAFLLYLYELKPSKFVDGQLAIPQAGNSIPDILDEVRWELEWLLKMQREDGGVYHKVSTKKWTGEYLPHRDPDKRYIFEVSSTATGAFAAVTALASRHYQRWDKPFAQQLLRAAVQAWEYLEAHPTIVPRGGFRNPSDVEGGEY